MIKSSSAGSPVTYKPTFEQRKSAIRDYLRKADKENEFTLLQAEVYGKRIVEAKPATGMIEALKAAAIRIDTVLISHKSKYPYSGPKYTTRIGKELADKHGFFDEDFGDGIYWIYTLKKQSDMINCG